MQRKKTMLMLLVILFIALPTSLFAQKMAFDGKLGLSFLTGNGSSTGLLIGGGLDFPFQERLYLRPELNITTHGGTPIELGGKVKYILPSSPMSTELYLTGGIGIWFYSGGSALGLDGGIGTLFPLSGTNLKIPVEIRLGPILESGNTVFQIALTTGVRMDIP